MYLNSHDRQKSHRRLRIWLLLALLYAVTGLLWLGQRQPLALLSPQPTAAPLEAMTSDGMTTDAAEHLHRAEIYFNQGNTTAAIESYEEAIAADPENPAMARAYARWAQLLALRQKKDEAMIRSERALALAPDDAEVIAARAMVLEWNAQTDEAMRLAQQAIDLDPNNASGYAFLAATYADSARYEEALATAQHATGLDPDNVWGWLELGYVHETRAEYSSAIAAYQEGLNVTPLSNIYVRIGRNYLVRSDGDENDPAIALDNYRQATVVDPRNPLAYAAIANAYLALDDFTGAIDAAERGIEQDPAYSTLYVIKGTSYYKQRNFESAIEQLEQAISYGYEQNDAYILLGLAYAYLEKCEQALPWLQRVIAQVPDEPSALAGLRICGAPVPEPVEGEPPPP